jgi:hypothetical protein
VFLLGFISLYFYLNAEDMPFLRMFLKKKVKSVKLLPQFEHHQRGLNYTIKRLKENLCLKSNKRTKENTLLPGTGSENKIIKG